MLLIALILQQQILLTLVTISANSFNATVATFSNQSGATITAAECNLVVHTSSSDNGTITCLDSEGNTAITNIAVPNSNGLSTQ